MLLYEFSLAGMPLVLRAQDSGAQQLTMAGQLVSDLPQANLADGGFLHQFYLQQGEQRQLVRLQIQPHVMPDFTYQLWADEQLVAQGQAQLGDALTRDNQAQTPRSWGVIGLASLAFKLFKSAKVLKVALAGASVAAYSWLFTFEFALMLLLCLVVHEYGHIRAMKYFGLKTKGIYLIPFVGGLALSDDKITSRWQDVVISIMGPTFGLLMSLLMLVVWGITDDPLWAGIAGFNALLNLFNLLPILPLDGGHILKSISFSMHSWVGLVACIVGSLVAVFISYQLGLALLGFLLLIGAVEIFFEWRSRGYSHLVPLDGYGQSFSAVWYLLTVAGFIAVIWLTATSGDASLTLPLQILSTN